MQLLHSFFSKTTLIQRILLGLIIGIAIALISPTMGASLGVLGKLFVGALKGIAPILVFFLVISAISRQRAGQRTNMKSVVVLYLIATFLSAAAAVFVSFMFPTAIHLSNLTQNTEAPSNIVAVIGTLLTNLVDNPVHALMSANYIGILGWGILFGTAFKASSAEAKGFLATLSDGCSTIVQWIIQIAPIGIMGLVADTIAEAGIESLLSYVQLLALLLGTMIFVALVINPLLVAIVLRKNPYPLVFRCIRESGMTAFFTRSSAANIPVNMELSKRLGINPDTYSISIPLGATINMGGAAITITIMTLACVHTLGITVDYFTALLLSVIAAIGACGASGVAGGSLLLIPLACSLFGITNDIAMQVVGVGFIIGVLQDATETALNSSTDVLFTATADFAKHGYPEGKV